MDACGKCFHWARLTDPNVTLSPWGKCFFAAPQPMAVSAPAYTTRPITLELDRCSNFKENKPDK